MSALAKAVIEYAKRATGKARPLVFRAKVLALEGDGALVTVDGAGRVRRTIPVTDEPYYAGDIALISETATAPIAHGKDRR